jgi:hypothetical protein
MRDLSATAIVAAVLAALAVLTALYSVLNPNPLHDHDLWVLAITFAVSGVVAALLSLRE